MSKIKIMTVVGTRPEIIRLSEVIKELDKMADHVLVHTGKNYDYDLNEIFFKNLGLKKPDYFLDAAKGKPSETVSNILIKIDPILEKEKPEAFLILGDTNSCMAAYAAKRRKIPVFHMEAGNRCFDARVPEELNRGIVDRMSDINIVYSDLARLNLVREGFLSDRIIKSSSPMKEVLDKNSKQIEDSNILKELDLKEGDYFVFSSHREENINIDKNFDAIIEIANKIAEKYSKPVIFPAHPRTKKKIDDNNLKLNNNIKIIKPLGFFDFVKLEKNALCTLSDSGTISEESSILNFQAVNIREAHERPEAMDETSVIMSGLNSDRVLQAIEAAVAQQKGEKRDFNMPNDYNISNVSKKIYRIILSYTDYIKRVNWLEK